MRLHALVAEAARRTPDALAVAAPEGELSYAELDALADRFAVAHGGRGVPAPGHPGGPRVVRRPCLGLGAAPA
ncbi:hypothetical protein ACFW7O_41465, partial [Streptomyces diastatochromogenes]